MTRKPRIPMLPSELPQQRLYLVKGLPERPANWSTKTGGQADDIAPAAMPRSARHIGQMEWAWSPMHMRIDAYYLSMCSHHRHWVLWAKGYDDNWGRWMKPCPVVVAERVGVAAEDAARLLVFDYWKEERTEDVDHFHWVNEGEMIDVGGLAEIGDAVWGVDEGEEA